MPLLGSPNIEHLKAKRDIDGLIKALRYKDSSIRAQAAEALREMAEVPKHQPKSEPRQNLNKSSYTRWIEGLIGCLKDNDTKVRQTAIAALMSIWFSPTTEFAAAAISTVLASGDKASEEAFVESVLRGGREGKLRYFAYGLSMALEGDQDDLYLGQNSPLAPRTIEMIITQLVNGLPSTWWDKFEQDRSVRALRRASHSAAIQPLFAIIADKRQLEQEREDAKETIQKKLFLVTILEKIMRLNLTAIENGILKEISDFTLLEPEFSYEEVEVESGLTLARTSRLGSNHVPTPGINSLAQEELRRRAATKGVA